MQTDILTEKKTYGTNYDVAVHWLNNSLILCNNIQFLDASVYENAHFDWSEADEIFQWFLTSCTDSDVEFLEDYFPGLLFTFSEKLDTWVLCVNHWGTDWSYVRQDTYLKYAERELGEAK